MPFLPVVFLLLPLSLPGLMSRILALPDRPAVVVEAVAATGPHANLEFAGLAPDLLSANILEKALQGYELLVKGGQYTGGHLLAVIDFTKSSAAERFFLFDLRERRLLRKSLVAHGRNSGDDRAEHFSNQPNSLQSSLGFYRCAETYQGQHGLSMRLDGLEKGINDNARLRNIVVHSADYVHPDFVRRHGRLGRSFGCPALPVEGYRDLIDTISQGCLLFIYADDPNYHQESAFMQPVRDSGLSLRN